MNEKEARLRYLLQAYIDDSITSIELQELKSCVSMLASDEDLYPIVDNLWNAVSDQSSPAIDSELVYRRIITDPRVSADPRHQADYPKKQHVIVSWRWAASIAAALLIIPALFFYFELAPTTPDQGGHAAMETTAVLPGSNKAMLTLADGREISLDEAAEGNLAEQAGVRIVKTEDGQLHYEPIDNAPDDALVYNTVRTPRGGEYQLVLPDGTKVWLNAASSLRYPVQFTHDQRKVELAGEAYFEVSHVGYGDARVPFVVSTAHQQVEVLGTQFNIKAYADETATRTTLLEGVVRVSIPAKGGEQPISGLLKPSQQATVKAGGKRISVATVDPVSAVAWKNGNFAFHDNTIVEIMNTISRWYDVSVEYEGGVIPVNKVFGGTISKFESFEKLLKTIELTGTVKFKIEGRRVIVMT